MMRFEGPKAVCVRAVDVRTVSFRFFAFKGSWSPFFPRYLPGCMHAWPLCRVPANLHAFFLKQAVRVFQRLRGQNVDGSVLDSTSAGFQSRLLLVARGYNAGPYGFKCRVSNSPQRIPDRLMMFRADCRFPPCSTVSSYRKVRCSVSCHETTAP